MKICFLTTIFGTTRIFVIPQTEYFKQKHPEWDISIACSAASNIESFLPNDIRYIPVKINRGIDFGALKTIRQLMKLFKREQFDMIVYATPNAAFYASIAGKLAKVPQRVYNQWGIRYCGFSGIMRCIFKFVEKITCTFSTNIHVISHGNRNFGIDEKLYSPSKASVVGNGGTIGVDLSRYDISKYEEYRREKRSELNIADDEFLIGFVGRLCKDKGIRELVDAVKHLAKTEKIKAVCIGRDELEEDIFTPEMKNWLSDTDKVIFTGQRPPEEVRKFYAAMDLYVHPTYREGFGMVLQEAGAMACPIITTNVPGASEVLENGVSCLLCEARSTESLCEAIQCLLHDRVRAKTLGENARLCVQTKYERGVMLENQLARYEELLGMYCDSDSF